MPLAFLRMRLYYGENLKPENLDTGHQGRNHARTQAADRAEDEGALMQTTGTFPQLSDPTKKKPTKKKKGR